MPNKLKMNMTKIITFSLFSLVLSFLSNNATATLQPTIAHNGMVVTEHYLASQVGVNILQKGGNAIDAAVAVGYALAVVDPCCGNIGGGGFMTIRLANGKTTFLNFREKAPLAAKYDMYLDKQGNVIPNKTLFGYQAIGVPGTVMGFEYALKKYGTMDRAELIAPAIKLAEKGFTLTVADVRRLYYDYNNLARFKAQTNVAAIFLKKGEPYQPGERLIQKDLAATLKLLVKKGTNTFYKGAIAKKIIKASEANGGILTEEDFKHYTVQELKPIYCNYRGYEIISAPPPSSGGITLCEALNILEGYPLQKLGFNSAESIHYITEAMQHAFTDRNNKLGDPDFVSNPITQLISKNYAAQIRKSIPADHASTSSNKSVKPTHEYVETTHYSITDKYGNAVSVTYTLNGAFGANVIASNTGFFLNNEMDDFSAKSNAKNLFGLVQSASNSIAPGKRPLSSMTPTIITKNNELFMVVGGPGGPRIITSTLLTILNTIDYKMNIKAAVDAGRIHHQAQPDKLDYEADTLNQSTVEKLTQMGHQLYLQKNWGAVAAIVFNSAHHIYYGAMDIRRPLGSALGY